ncbi:MAG: tRNA pseudouridine(38-40) synthase TruA [Bdellovibrionales bacterium]|nr:tRNA pseudouridine(38-40) synthase TruA [Bdellovibrionales bacterium]
MCPEVNANLEPPHRIRLLISYDGTDFGGWQKQPRGKPTIQGSLEEVFTQLFDEPVKVIGSGRTDSGVHAIGQVAHLVTTKNPRRYKLLRAANSLLPSGIVVRQAWEAPREFHAMASATHKTYRYWILNRPFPSALRGRYVSWFPRPLHLEYLQSCARFIEGTHDFASFQTAGSDITETTRHIRSAQWGSKGSELLYFSITGEGFLKQMVRNLVGTMTDLYYAGRPATDMKSILELRDRRMALGTAQPEGLRLCEVFYLPDLDNKCRTL